MSVPVARRWSFISCLALWEYHDNSDSFAAEAVASAEPESGAEASPDAGPDAASKLKLPASPFGSRTTPSSALAAVGVSFAFFPFPGGGGVYTFSCI